MFEEGEKMELSRRDFLRKAATASVALSAIGVAGCASGNSQGGNQNSGEQSETDLARHTWEIKPGPISDIVSEEDYDIVIVGAGPSGCAAAEAASAKGAKVAVIEQAKSYTAHGADNGCIGSSVQKANGVDISPEEATKLLYRFSQQTANKDLIYTWASRSGEVFEHLIKLCANKGIGTVMAISGTSKVDWADLDEPFREYRTGLTFGSKEEGIVIDVANFTFIQSHIVGTLIDAAISNGADVFYNTHAEQLIGEASSGITGVIVTAEDGSHVQYNAKKGVILATGDISGNQEMVDYFAPIARRADQCQYFPAKGNLGEGLLMGMWAGAAHSKSAAAPMIHPIAPTLPLTSLDMSWLAVNRLGERYGCEVPYEPLVTNARMNQPGNVGYSIFDGRYEERVIRQEPVSGKDILANASDSIAKNVSDGTMWKAQTLDELAKQIKVPAGVLKETVKRYNDMCAAGIDDDFGVPSRFLAAVDTPPFYAEPVAAITLTIPFGLHVDKNSQVCTENDEPIEGLFAVGNVQGDFFGMSYPVTCPGISHGRALTFGQLVGAAIADGTTING